MEKDRFRYARSFRELVVYQLANGVAARVFDITEAFPRHELYAVTDQLRRASRSIGAQIAEAWGKRRYRRQFVYKLTDADAEQMEAQHWIAVAGECGYLSKETQQSLLSDLQAIGRMLHSMIQKAHLFCQRPDDH